MKSERSEGRPVETSRGAATGPDPSGRSGEDDLKLEDFQSLLKLLKITLPKNVLNDEVINKSKSQIYSQKADAIVNNLKRIQLRFALTPRLQCRTVKKANILKKKKRVRDLTRMIFFRKRKKTEQTLKQMWKKIPLKKRLGFRIKDTFQETKKGRSARVGKVFSLKKGKKAKFRRDHQYYYQTQAYLYILKKTKPLSALASAAMVIRKYQEEDEDEDDADEDGDYQYHDDDQKELKGDFSYNYVTKEKKMFDKLNNYCKSEALPLYLSVLNKIFEKQKKGRKNSTSTSCLI
ncbi:hypothetical protein Baya_5439 [Bagarius yarrelli]|uniref:Uncharacterized protein n=1 Tax=Bagarius yarrelli TaxID=175774 RepID=A0A556TUV7_BAGYA|nr:hypothetical protein Baya_5439 [Bagarius yarrelli]